jgi:hypothetical protein
MRLNLPRTSALQTLRFTSTIVVGEEMLSGTGFFPIVSTTRVYDSVRTGQEDWGWFLWMRLGKELTRVHIQCDDKDGGIFRIHVFGSVKQWLRWKDIDTLEVERMNEVILNEIKKWGTINRTKRFTPDFTREI